MAWIIYSRLNFKSKTFQASSCGYESRVLKSKLWPFFTAAAVTEFSSKTSFFGTNVTLYVNCDKQKPSAMWWQCVDKCHRALYYAKLARHSLGASSSGRTEICKTPAEMTCVVSSTATLNIFHTSGARQVVAIISISNSSKQASWLVWKGSTFVVSERCFYTDSKYRKVE